MSKVYFGKISRKFPMQFEENYYAGGARTSSWYGQIDVGDYVFPIYQGKVEKLWRVKSFNNTPSPIRSDGRVNFDVVKVYDKPISVSTQFIRYKHFLLDLNLLNKSMKSTARGQVGFYPIQLADNCPSPEAIEFEALRNVYIAFEGNFNALHYQEGDLRILIDSPDHLRIKAIQIYQSAHFAQYSPLNELYLAKNPSEQRYNLTKLLEFSIKDLATNKEKYLKAVIEELKRRGFFKVNSPVKLYDNVLVGRKRTHPRKANATSTAPPSVEPDATHEDYDHYQEYVDLLQFNPNLILYGPPGTGKTFSVEKIIEAFEYDRTEEETTFQELTEQGRVRFVTFHQSFSYEEFVEGLRPMTNDNESGQSHGLKYEVKPGILRQMANKAVISQLQEDFEGNQLQHIGESSTVWKVSLGSRGKEEEVYKDCIQSNTIAIGWLPGEDLHNWSKQDIYQALEKENTNGSDRPTNDSDTIYKFVNEIQIGDVVLVFASVNSIRAIGVVTGAYYRDETKPNYYFHRRKVSWLKIFDQPFEILKYNDNVRLTLKTVYKLTRIEFSDIKEMLQIDEAENKKPKSAALPHFLIIDEINRGNISKIFGELITLIEKDKRDKIKVQLPYSQSTFSLPANLYIIGTMNTADRSIALLDTALRRRFAFKELEPDVEVIKNNDPFVDDDIDLALLLERLNEQITQKIDRDHRIGHAYFLDVYHLKQLKLIWYYQILPLLMEYFYNDGKAIASIVTSNFIDENSAQIKWIEHDERFKQAIVNVQNQKL